MENLTIAAKGCRNSEILADLTSMEGVRSVAVTDGGGDFLAAFNQLDGRVDSAAVLSAVLAEAVVSAAGALAHRGSAGECREILISCDDGFLLLVPSTNERLLLVQLGLRAHPGLVKLAARRVAGRLDELDIAPARPVARPTAAPTLADALDAGWTGF